MEECAHLVEFSFGKIARVSIYPRLSPIHRPRSISVTGSILYCYAKFKSKGLRLIICRYIKITYRENPSQISRVGPSVFGSFVFTNVIIVVN